MAGKRCRWRARINDVDDINYWIETSAETDRYIIAWSGWRWLIVDDKSSHSG